MTATPILTRVLRYGGVLTLGLAVIGSVIGFLVAGVPGLVSALIAGVLTMVMLAMTAGSILLAVRLTKGDMLNPIFFAIVLGVWLLKLVLFIVALVVLRDQPFIQPMVMFVTILVAVIGSLVVDIVAFVRARVPYVSDVTLPGESPESMH